MLSDLLWLLIQLQLVMGLVVVATPPELPLHVRVGGIVVLGLAVVLFWVASLQAVSHAGIRRPFKRAVVFLVLMPGTLLAILGVPLVLMACFSRASPLAVPFVAMALLAVLVGGIAALRWLAAWCAARDSP